MAKSEFYIGAAKVADVSAQQDVDAVRSMLSVLSVPTFVSLSEAKGQEREGWNGKIRYVRVTTEVVEEGDVDAFQTAIQAVEAYNALAAGTAFDTEGRD